MALWLDLIVGVGAVFQDESLKICTSARIAGNSVGKKRSAGRSAVSSAVACATKECGTALGTPPGTPLFPAPFPAVLPALLRNSSPAPLSGASGFAKLEGIFHSEVVGVPLEGHSGLE